MTSWAEPRPAPARPQASPCPYCINSPNKRAERKAAFLKTNVTDQRVIAVYFDKNRRVQRLADYGMKDGKIFDFVARETPAGGQELSYITYLFKIIGTQ